MSIRWIIVVACCLISIGAARSSAHDGHEIAGSDGERTWTHASGLHRLEGSFVAMKGDQVQVRSHHGDLVEIKFDALSTDDRLWVRKRKEAIERLNHQPELMVVARNLEVEPARGLKEQPEIQAIFQPFATKLKFHWDDDFFYVESNGMPDHRMMVGIKSWQQQVPIPQNYTADNAWKIPLHPVPARNPISAKNHFLRGAIALAPNGVPIFNPLNNRGEDALLFGELDEFGGHCGRADDYHYHLAPVHLEKTVGKGLPIAYALDGYPIYGYSEPDGSSLAKLDSFNGHEDGKKRYHYHASKTYPYLNGGFHGEVTERGGQVDPQPRAEPIREAGEPLRGATITDFRNPRPGSYGLTYELRGRKNQVNYEIAANGSVKFDFIDGNGKTTTATYQRRGGPGPGNRAEGGRENPPPPGGPDDGPPPPPPEGRRPPRSPLFLALDRNQDGRLTRDELAQAQKSLLTLDRNKDGKLTEEEVRPEPPGGRPGPQDNPAADPGTTPGDFGPLVVTSPAFAPGGKLPADFTCDGAGVSPPIEWKGAPEGTKSFAVNVWHVPGPGDVKSYWVVYNIPATANGLARASEGVGVVGPNDKRHASYDPMCSKGPGLKTYHITVYALSKELTLAPEKANRAELLKAIADCKLAQKTLSYQYERTGQE
jgi:phosphatidylethanolamine-binding protein (PEBP) family uncharacterized protein